MISLPSKLRPLWAIAASLLVSLDVFLSAADAAATNENCPSHGCPLLPLDIISHEKTKTSLEVLRILQNDPAKSEDTKRKVEHVLDELVSAGDNEKVTLTLCGDKGDPGTPINQDRAMIYSPYNIQGFTSGKAQLLGVFDGHGEKGELTSEHAVTEIPSLLSEKLGNVDTNEEEVVSQAIKETFIEVDKTDPSNGKGGATATIVLQLEDRLYIGNSGDSRSFVGVLLDDSVEIVFSSREDKPDLPEEKERIAQAGGYVHISKEDVPRAYAVRPDGKISHGVAMSRSLGDWDCQGVIAEPIVDVLNITELALTKLTSYIKECKTKKAEQEAKSNLETDNKKVDDDDDETNCDDYSIDDVDVFAVSASDGLVDFVNLEYIAHVFAAAFFVPDNPHPFTGAEYLMLQAAQRWKNAHNGQYRDDIAVAASRVFTSFLSSSPSEKIDDDKENEDPKKPSAGEGEEEL